MAVFLLVFNIKNSLTGEPHPTNFIQAICYYSGIGWWLRPFIETDPHNYWYEWYIPTLLVLYALFPMLYKYSCKKLIRHIIVWVFAGSSLIILSSVLRNFYGVSNYITNSLSQLHWSYQRVPIFLCGVLIYKVGGV